MSAHAKTPSPGVPFHLRPGIPPPQIPKKNPRKGKRATSTEKWKNIGYWADLSQLLASYTRQVLRTEIGKTTFTALSRDLRTLTQAIERIGEQCVRLWGRGCHWPSSVVTTPPTSPKLFAMCRTFRISFFWPLAPKSGFQL